MPTVLRERGFRFFFWSDERNEPPHIHARSGDAYAKLRLGPPVTLAESHDCSPQELRVVVVTARATSGSPDGCYKSSEAAGGASHSGAEVSQVDLGVRTDGSDTKQVAVATVNAAPG